MGLILTACGDDPDASGPPILLVTGSGVAAPNASADATAGAAESKMWAPVQMNFVAGADLPALDSDAASYSMSVGSFTADDVAALAAAFGVSGDVVELGSDVGGGYRVGSDDGSTDSFWVSGDAMGYWSFSPRWDEQAATGGCAIASSPDGTVSTEPVDCATPEPPANVPSQDEARALFSSIVSDLNMNVDDMQLESYADAWGASVYGYLEIDGVRSPLTVSVGFGAEGALTFASGFLGEVVRGADYPRIGTAAALERLNAQFTNPMLRGGVAMGANDVAISEVATAGTTAEASATDVTVEGVPTTDVMVDEVPQTDVPLEVQDISIVAVEEELVMLYAQDGSIYLVPGYAFIAAEDEYGYTPRYTVSAIPDEYVQQVDPIDVTIEPAVEPAVDPAVGSSDVVIADADAQALVGATEAEATEAAKSKGWDVRVVSRDGEDFAVTMDYRMDRVNLTVVDDVVTAASVG